MASLVLCTILLFFANTTTFVSSATLSLVECDATLPTPRAALSAVFDGFDTIYLLGGYDGGGFSLQDVLTYSISQDQISQGINPLPEGLHDGCAFRSRDDRLIYAGGYNASSVYTTATDENSPWSLLSTLPTPAGYVGCISEDPWSAKLFGGWDSKEAVIHLDLQSGESTHWPAGLGTETCTLANAVWNPLSGNATIFCSVASYMPGRILSYHHPSRSISQVGPNTNRSFYNSASAFDGVNAYIIGGWHSESLPPWGGDILSFNTLTQSGERLDVDNLPSWDNATFDLAEAVYVPYLNRVYIFGGRRGLFQYLDTIWYMDLQPVNPVEPIEPPNSDIFRCADKLPGLYPHPVDCSMYIICGVGGGTIVQKCPQPLLYDGGIKACNFPEDVECLPSCSGKPAGFYPHPHDCALYISCRGGGDEEVEVLRCPPPSLFDPILTTCNPELVDCEL